MQLVLAEKALHPSSSNLHVELKQSSLEDIRVTDLIHSHMKVLCVLHCIAVLRPSQE